MTGFSVHISESSHDFNDDSIRYSGTAGVRGPRWARLPLLSLGTLGMQVLWSVEMGYGQFSSRLARFLVQLLFTSGLTRHSIAVPYFVGSLEISHVDGILGRAPLWPDYAAFSWYVVSYLLTSNIIQFPITLSGAFSDRCTSRFGRRRPYLVGGTLVAMVALLLLGYTKSVASIFGLSDEHVSRFCLSPPRIPKHICHLSAWPFNNLAGGILNISHRLLCQHGYGLCPSFTGGYPPRIGTRSWKCMVWTNVRYRQHRWLLRVRIISYPFYVDQQVTRPHSSLFH